MSLTAANVRYFRQRVDSTLEALLPAVLVIGGQTISAASPGGRRGAEFPDGGQATTLTIDFRINKLVWPGPLPVIGQPIDWLPESGRTVPLMITAIADRPHDPSHAITCGSRRV